MTTRGFGTDEFEFVVAMMDRVIESQGADAAAVRSEVRALCDAFPLYDATFGAEPLIA